MKPLTPTERNQKPILEVLIQYISEEGRLLEIGSGDGGHAVYIAQNLPKLHWVTSDLIGQHFLIKKKLKSNKLSNVHGPETLKIGVDDFPKTPFDYVFTANTLHIMSWKEDKTFFKLIGRRLREGCLAFFYGPFNYNGTFTTASNEEFDKWLKEKNSKSGIRGFEEVQQNMKKCGFKLLKDHEMPANNRLLVFERLPFIKI